jgi:glycosyltransferase involved in cell wall biosynthesis
MATVSEQPRVSVVITCYNLGRYLDEAVDSVLDQTFQDFEIVVVDDGSSDADTLGVLARYPRPRTRVVRIDNRGLPGARNEGIRRTTGDYVCALDADDRLERTYFEKAVAVLDENPSIAFVSHWLRTFGEGNHEDWTPRSAAFPDLLDRNTVNGAALVRRDALLAAGLFDETMRQGCEDWDLWIGLVERGFHGVILPEVLFFYRRRPDSMSRVMLEGDTHSSLYRHLVEKHRPSFEGHLIDLLVRRERDRQSVLRESHDLELDYRLGLAPEIERLRDGLRVAQNRLDRVERRSRADAELGQLREISAASEVQLAEQSRVLEAQAGQLAAQTAELERRAQVLAERDARLGAQDDRIAEQENRLVSQQARIAGQGTHLAAQAAALAEHDVERARTQTGILALRAEIGALRSSWSWRITAPLRAMYACLVRRR